MTPRGQPTGGAWRIDAAPQWWPRQAAMVPLAMRVGAAPGNGAVG